MTIEEYPFLTDYALDDSGLHSLSVNYSEETSYSLDSLAASAVEGAFAKVVRNANELSAIEDADRFDLANLRDHEQDFFDQYDLLLVEFQTSWNPERMVAIGVTKDQESTLVSVAALPDYQPRSNEPSTFRIARALMKKHHYYGEYSYPREPQVIVANAFDFCHGDGVNVFAALQLATDIYAPGFGGLSSESDSGSPSSASMGHDYANAQVTLTLMNRGQDGSISLASAFSGNADEDGYFFAPNVVSGLYRMEVEGAEGEATLALFPCYTSEFQLIDPEGEAGLYA